MGIPHCPESAELQEYALGLLPCGRFDEIEAHLETCEHCRTAFLQVHQDHADPLLAAIRQLPALESHQSATYRRGMEHAREIGRQWIESDARPETSQPRPPMLPLQIREYRLIEEIKQGGMGTVYRALHLRLKREVAVKLLSPVRAGNTEAVARFLREMEVIGRLNHPGIVHATDAGEEDGTYFIVMEYLHGVDLSTLVGRTGPLRTADACELVRQAAEALQHAHEHGLVHRDVKPSNLMLVRQEQATVATVATVKLLDLGLARLQLARGADEELTSDSHVMGTLDFMAPEQFTDARSVDIRADLYGLGCTLYYLLAGHAPFYRVERTALEVMRAHAEEAVPPLTEKRPDLPPELVSILDRLLAKQPSHRFATPAEVAAAVKPLAANHDLTGLLQRTAEPSAVETESRKLSTAAPRASSEAVASEQSVPAEGDRPKVAAGRRNFMIAAGLVILLVLAGSLFTNKDPNTPEQKPSSPGTVSEPDIARAVISRGGSVNLHGDGRHEITSLADLPRGSFMIQAVFFPARSQPTAADVEPLTQIDTLHELSLGGDSVLDDALLHVERLTALRWLHLRRTHITNAGLKHLLPLKQLLQLELNDSDISHDGVRDIRTLENLVWLDLSETGVTDGALEHLAGHPSLETLILNSTSVTGAGLEHLSTLPQLRRLSLRASKIDDAAVAPLLRLQQLTSLDIRDTRLSEGAGARLKASLPECDIQQ